MHPSVCDTDYIADKQNIRLIRVCNDQNWLSSRAHLVFLFFYKVSVEICAGDALLVKASRQLGAAFCSVLGRCRRRLRAGHKQTGRNKNCAPQRCRRCVVGHCFNFCLSRPATRQNIPPPFHYRCFRHWRQLAANPRFGFAKTGWYPTPWQ